MMAPRALVDLGAEPLGAVTLGTSRALGGLGCHYSTPGFGSFWSAAPATTADAAYISIERVCACEY